MWQLRGWQEQFVKVLILFDVVKFLFSGPTTYGILMAMIN